MFVRSIRNHLLEYLENRLTLNYEILHGHSNGHFLQPQRIRRHLLPVGSCSGKTVENTASDGFGWNFLRTYAGVVVVVVVVVRTK